MIKTLLKMTALGAMILATGGLGCGDEATEPTPQIEPKQQSKTLTCGQAQCQVDAQVCLNDDGEQRCVSVPDTCTSTPTCDCVKDALAAKDCTADPDGGLRVVATVIVQDPCMALTCMVDEECERQEDGSAKCVATEPDPLPTFPCGDQACVVDTHYCSEFTGGVPGSGTSASCVEIPAQCQAAMLDCDCLKTAQGAQDCSQDATTMGYTVRTFAP